MAIAASVGSCGCAGEEARTTAAAGAGQAPPQALAAESHPQIFQGMGSHHRKVSTGSSEAQRYFDQGLTLAFSFNHDEAIHVVEASPHPERGVASAERLKTLVPAAGHMVHMPATATSGTW